MELALTPDSRWETDVTSLADAARVAGFGALGLNVDRVDHAAVAAYEVAGLRCHELLGFQFDGGPSTLDRAERIARAAATMRAPWVLTFFRAGIDADALEVLARAAAMFAEVGARVAVEFSPLGPVPSVAAGLEVVAAVGRDRAGLLIDSWHFCIGDSSWEDLERVPLEQIAYIQFDDALAPLSDDLWDETMNRRAMPGEGVLELDRFASTLRERGWDGVVSIEVLSAECRAMPVAEVARRAHDSLVRFWL